MSTRSISVTPLVQNSVFYALNGVKMTNTKLIVGVFQAFTYKKTPHLPLSPLSLHTRDPEMAAMAAI